MCCAWTSTACFRVRRFLTTSVWGSCATALGCSVSIGPAPLSVGMGCVPSVLSVSLSSIASSGAGAEVACPLAGGAAPSGSAIGSSLGSAALGCACACMEQHRIAGLFQIHVHNAGDLRQAAGGIASQMRVIW